MAEVEADGDDDIVPTALEIHGLYTCPKCNKPYMYIAELVVQAEHRVGPPKHKTELSRGELIPVEMWQSHVLGIYMSSTMHPHLANVVVEKMMSDIIFPPPNWPRYPWLATLWVRTRHIYSLMTLDCPSLYSQM